MLSKTRSVYVGIDPGISGAVAFLFRDIVHNYVLDLPRTVDGKDYDIPKLYDILLTESNSAYPMTVAMEQVTRPAKLTRCAGIIEGLLTALDVSYTSATYIKVLPATWMRALDLPAPHKKADSLALARELYPEMADQLTRAKDDGRAEAILIAHWLRKEVE
jgi:hypothetical protein